MAERRKDYDSAYKYLFSNKRIFHQFLTQFIDEGFTRKIKLEDIEQVDRSFVSDEFLQRESDIIYKVKLEGREVYIYVLLEFQSTVDKSIPVRMLLYILQLYDQLIRNSRRGKLPAVFPILLYNGSEKWTVGRDLARLIEQSIPAKYIPSFHYYAVIEQEVPDRVLKRAKGLVSAIIYLEKQGDDAALGQAIETVIELIREEQPEQLRMFSTWVNRMFGKVLSEEEAERITKLTEVKSMLAQLAEDIEKRGIKLGEERGIKLGEKRGIKLGEKRGVNKGVKEGKREDARRMKARGYPVQDIVDITGLSAEEVEKL
jgi:predicted transposase/invertase (TIGR01784 family)